MKKILLSGAALVSVLAMVSPANAAAIYMTGTSNPWGTTTNDGAMDAAFGVGSWTKVMGFDGSVFNPANSFIFFDGSDINGIQFASFLAANMASLTSFVNSGGKVFSNIATNVGPATLDLGFGYTSTWPQFSTTAALTAAGITAGLGAGGAGNAWIGGSFGHNINTGGTGACYVLGNSGCVFAGGAEGSGAYFVGGQTTTNYHSGGGFELRVNELRLASEAGPGAVPEPSTWALMIGGFGAIGGTMRYRRRKTTVAFA